MKLPEKETVHKRSLKRAGLILAAIILLPGLLVWLTYHNRQHFIPKVEAVKYLQVQLDRDTTVVQAGIQVQNRAPVPFTIDSIRYEIRNRGERLGWGRQVVQKRLPAYGEELLDFRLLLDTDKYRKQLERHKDQDSLHLDVKLQVYLDPPLLQQQRASINRTFATAIPKAPALKIDTLLVTHFSPEAGYTFELHLNTENTHLPQLQLENLAYQIRFSDSLLIDGRIDTTFRIAEGAKTVAVPIHLETSEMIGLLLQQLQGQTRWPYQAKASATVKSTHPLFEQTLVSVSKAGTADMGKFSSGTVAMPSVKRVQSLALRTQEKHSYLQAQLLIHNPTPLPLYLDSARYVVRHKGKTVAFGGKDFELVFPAKGDRQLPLQLTINNQHYKQIAEQAQGKDEVPLVAELLLHYNLKDSKPQQIVVKKEFSVPVTEGPSFRVADIGIKQLDPKKGAQLFVKLEVQNQNGTHLLLDDLDYEVVVDKHIGISGKTSQLISLNSGASEIELPVDLSATDVNLLSKGLLQGKESWDYAFAGTATVSSPNSLLRNTRVSLQTGGVFNINSKGTPDYMPEISKIDTLHVTIHYDTAWVRMYAAIYNTLPVAVHVTQLEVDVLHEQDLIGRADEELHIALVPDTNTFAWHTLGVNYGNWEQHVLHHQGQDSMLLSLPTTLTFELGNLGRQQVLINMDKKIPTPAAPVTLLERVRLRGFSFRNGLRFNALVAVQNANSEGLTVKNIDYHILLENGVDITGKLDETYRIPLGVSEVQVPMHLGVWESLKMLKRQLFGPALINYKLNATAIVSTGNPKLQNVHVFFENHSQSNLKEKKTISRTP